MSEMIYILLPVHNRSEVTRRFIECLKVQTYRDYHLVLIDDGSSDGTAEMVRENIRSLTIIRGTGDWWWAGSLQQGYRWLKRQIVPGTDFVLIINDDTEFEVDFLQNAISFLSSRERTLLLAQSYCRENGCLLDAGIHVNWSKFTFEQAVSPVEINCLSTRGLFMRLSDFFTIGGFYPNLLPHYASDYEFTIRARRKGMLLVSDSVWRLKIDQSTTGFHKLNVRSLKNLLGKIFSNRSVENPFMWTAFITLSCPWRYMLVNIIRVWMNFLGTIYQALRYFVIDRIMLLYRYKKPLRVVLGAGVVGQKGWLSTDIHHLNILLNEDWQRYFSANSIDALFAEHVWEHLSEADGLTAAKNCFTYLKHGGYMRVAVPDGFHSSSEYIDAVKVMGSGFGSDDHKVLFTYISLSKVFESAGFSVELLEYFDECGVFHQKEWKSEEGHVKRSERYDQRNNDYKRTYTSIILDAKK